MGNKSNNQEMGKFYWPTPMTDPEWEMYFERRLNKQTAENLKYRKKRCSLYGKSRMVAWSVNKE
ncbi:Uncharacterized protein dnl_23630 [Desulfonema limicola]|uniref:Uncharacterized protein n=2 Tax=Desulfonema limicola TaxID=45656 RepID=A0A975B746_9BACT|nr:Uncharacterized protein dnl_23630 [Desulfonema limicola]